MQPIDMIFISAGYTIKNEIVIREKENRMKKGSVFIVGLAAGIVFAALVASSYIIIHRIRTSLSQEDFISVYTGADARNAVDGFFNGALPEDAEMLYFREEGFMDVSYHVGLSLAPESAWKLIAEYSGKTKEDFQPLDYHPGPPGEPSERNPYWDAEAMVQPVYVELMEETEKGWTERFELIVYDEPTQRLLISLMLP